MEDTSQGHAGREVVYFHRPGPHNTEACLKAVDAGLVPEGRPVVPVAGTGRGADTVCLVNSAASKRFPDLFVSQVLAKPMAP